VKTVLNWFATKILVPVLRILLVEVLMAFVAWLIEVMKDMLNKWRTEETEGASTSEEQEAIREKFRRRQADLDSVANGAAARIRTIVDEAISRADKEQHMLLGGAPDAK